MEDSEVLNQDTNNQNNQTQTQPQVPQDPDSGVAVIESVNNETPQTGNVPVVGEADHATDIANNTMSHDESSTTYGYNSQGQKTYDESVTTSTHQSGMGTTISATWDSEYKMGDKYKVDDSQDYTWNKLATEMAQLDYAQQEAQARYESVSAKQQLDQQASSAFNNYFAAKYSAKQTQDKMGWSGGQQTASDLQVAFLQAETAANMYTQDEAQRYGVETKLGIARMYADANQKALALQYYQDAVDTALREADITGYYIEPEAAEMMKQQELANDILNDPNATKAEKDRAKQVNKNAEDYYRSLGFTSGTRKENGKVVTEWRGVKTLALLSHEETVRANKANERLQDQANKIASSAAGAAWANVHLQEKIQNWQESQVILQDKNIVGTTADGRNVYKENGKLYVQSNNSNKKGIAESFTGKYTAKTTTPAKSPNVDTSKIVKGIYNGAKAAYDKLKKAFS